MLSIGAPLRIWTLCLLLSSLSTCGVAQPTNETANEPSAVATAIATSSKHAASSFVDSECPFRTINYITHTLPQQCLRTGWVQSTVEESEGAESTAEAPGAPEEVVEDGREPGVRETEEGTPSDAKATGTSAEVEMELETDSPLDNANFLSFEEWKNRNLAQAGQSPDNVGQGRGASNEQRGRRRPVNVNALDSLGEEGEIEIDFSGFGSPSEPSSAVSNTQNQGEAASAAGSDKAAPSAWALSKDAGKTCKERFNYASFDCAATVVKTNPKAKSSTSILVENKDSYMLNECSADNKFIIVELCDDILVDTIVLANYEFFSSMFRHFRISVSDRYPVKMDRWRVLGTFEARNSRDVQPFLIKEPQIWARYLRVEFLTHYGNEYYCPMSLLRVHGTTMMEQFRREEEQARGDDADEPIEVVAGEPVQSAAEPIADAEIPLPRVPVETDRSISSAEAPARKDDAAEKTRYAASDDASNTKAHSTPAESTSTKAADVSTTSAEMTMPASSSEPTHSVSAGAVGEDAVVATSKSIVPSPSVSPSKSDSGSVPTESEVKTAGKPDGSSSASAKTGSNATTSSQTQKPAQTQPNPATPSTQESFFKSIHKRLQYLEANSTLSLQYIEEQSRILRDAFMKVEKKQLQKTEKFLDHLNSTVMHELKTYRNMYDQLWQSTILELEGMKERQKVEVGEIGARLSMMADELVWQKRMAVVQSTLLLLCLGLVLFVRSGTLGSQSDMPIAQQLGRTYSSFFDSPPHGSENSRGTKRRRTFRSMWRSDTSIALSDRSGHMSDANNAISDTETDGRRSPLNISYEPSSPTTPGDSSHNDNISSSPPRMNGIHLDENSGLLTPTEDTDTQAKRLEALETQSGPATPRGSRDNRPSWEEVDRAVDLLKAEESGKSVQVKLEMDRQRRRRRSPLTRAESYDGTTVDSHEDSND